MQVNDLPPIRLPVQNDRPAIHNSRPVVQMKRRNGNISEHLDQEIARLQIHIRGLLAISANLREYLLESSIDLCLTVRFELRCPAD